MFVPLRRELPIKSRFCLFLAQIVEEIFVTGFLATYFQSQMLENLTQVLLRHSIWLFSKKQIQCELPDNDL